LNGGVFRKRSLENSLTKTLIMSKNLTLPFNKVAIGVLTFCCLLGFRAEAFQKVYENAVNQGESVGMSILAAVDNPDETIVAGTTTGNSYNKDLISLAKIDQSGNVLWSYFYDSPDAANIRCMAIEYGIGGGYVITGYYEHINTGNFIGYVMELDASGGVLWRKNYEGLSVGLTILKTTNGSYLVGGLLSSEITESSLGRAGALLKLNPVGNVQWHRLMNSSGLNNNPESDFDFIETIVELDNNEYFVAGGVNAVYTDGLTSFQHITEKIFAAKIDNSGNLLWNSSFGNKLATPGTDDYHGELQMAADAKYDATTKTIYLLANNGTKILGEAVQSVYQMDEATGSVSTVAEFKHPTVGIPPKGSPEGFHCNQLRLDGDDIWLYGYVSLYVDEFNCISSGIYFPFQFRFDKNNPGTNTFTVHKTNNHGYPLAWNGFLEVFNPNGVGTGGESVPRVHSPEMAIRREADGTEYHTLLGYGPGVDFELYDDYNGGPICNTDATDLATLSPPSYKSISIEWSFAPRIYDDFYSQRYSANLDDDDCMTFICLGSQPVMSGIDALNSTEDVLEIYPNPTSGAFIVAYKEGISPDASISITDLFGKELMRTKLKERNTIDLSGLSNSPYLLKIYNNGRYSYQTVVKQ